MAAVRVVQSILSFLTGVVSRDRYLMEAVAAFTTFLTGVIASFTQQSIVARQALADLRDMPGPEWWVLLFCAPGIWSAVQVIRGGEEPEGKTSLAVMLSFVALCLFSLAIGLSNWGFWALFALLLGTMKGYALICEWTYLRWSVACLGVFYWMSLTLSVWINVPVSDLPLAFATFFGFLAANLLTVWRARGRRNG